jgi:hypothetical protein
MNKIFIELLQAAFVAAIMFAPIWIMLYNMKR